MDLRKEIKAISIAAVVFILFYNLPAETERFRGAAVEAFALAKWYAREHVLLCLIPAFFIAGAIAVFINSAAIMKYLGAGANRVVAYGVASVSGGILAVCSCTILPLFAGIYRMGAGIGPATAFLYSGPAINILAVSLTASVLGAEIGIARAVGAVVFSIVIGLFMELFHGGSEDKGRAAQMPDVEDGRSAWQNIVYFALLILILVSATLAKPDETGGLSGLLYANKWALTIIFAVSLCAVLYGWFGVTLWKLAAGAGFTASSYLIPGASEQVVFSAGVIALSVVIATEKGEVREWFEQSWGFARQILPLLLAGVLIAGFLLGRVGNEGMIPSEWVSISLGGESLRANFIASFAGAFMYFATLTEIPIIQGLMDNGMGKGPALSLLLAGPALSLPNMLVIRSVLGTKKTATFVLLVVVMATFSGYIFGKIF